MAGDQNIDKNLKVWELRGKFESHSWIGLIQVAERGTGIFSHTLILWKATTDIQGVKKKRIGHAIPICNLV